MQGWNAPRPLFHRKEKYKNCQLEILRRMMDQSWLRQRNSRIASFSMK
jgi:hypothetical protein